MDIRELRIGNWIRHKNENGVFDLQVVGIHDGAVDVKYNGGTWALSADVIAPIPLTEELLLKCGFVKHNWGVVTYYSPLLELNKDYTVKGIDYNLRIKFLHQLQNLYFALTGEELEIKL